MKVALVHDWLINWGGAERVLEALCEDFAGPIYTLVKDEKMLRGTSLRDREVRTSFLQKIPRSHLYYRNLVPFFPAAIERLDLSEHSLIISSSFAVAKSVKKREDQVHICYCHTPFRAAWDHIDFYLSTLRRPVRPLARTILRRLREFDRETQARVDHFVANSHYVAERIKRHYGRESVVIHPPVDIDLFEVSKKKKTYITCSRLVSYKRVDVLIEAFRKMPDRQLIIVGDGPEMGRLKSRATSNVKLLGHIPHEDLRKHLSVARAFLFAAEEDFGIAMVEALASGVPVIAFGKGGSRDIVLPHQTGLFFHKQELEAVIDAVERFETMEGDFDPDVLINHAQKFSKSRFKKEMRELYSTHLSIKQHSAP